MCNFGIENTCSTTRRTSCPSARTNPTVSFQWKNPDFLFKNPDFLIRNPDFLLKNVDFRINTDPKAGNVCSLRGPKFNKPIKITMSRCAMNRSKSQCPGARCRVNYRAVGRTKPAPTC